MAKRIIRLTESDLMRVVKRIIKETDFSNYKPDPNYNPNNPKGLSPEQLATQFCNSFTDSTFGNDDETTAMWSVIGLRNKKEYDRFVAQVAKTPCKSKTGMSVSEVLNKYMSAADSEYDKIVSHISDLGGGYVGKTSTSNTILRGIRKGLTHDSGSTGLSGTGA